MAENENTNPKWEGVVKAELKGVTADQVWPYMADFCKLDKWFVGLGECYRVEGEEGKPGVVRYCSTPPQTFFGGTDPEAHLCSWAKETLLMIDPKEMCLKYDVGENNMGVTSYVATFKVFPVVGGCRIEWSYSCDPVEGITWEGYNSMRASYINASVNYLQNQISSSA